MDAQGKETEYYLTTVTYGLKAAAFMAVRALLQLVEDEGHHFPLAVLSLTHGRYVDDIFGGVDSTEQLTRIVLHLRNIYSTRGFPIAKWHSTHPEINKEVSAK